MSFEIPVKAPEDSVKQITLGLRKFVVLFLSSDTNGWVLMSTANPSAIPDEPPFPIINIVPSLR